MKLQNLLFIILLAGCAPDEERYVPLKWYSGQTIQLLIYTDIDTLPVKFTNDQMNFMSQTVYAPGYTYVYDNMMREGDVITARASTPDSGYVHFDLVINGVRVAGSSGTYNRDSTFTSFQYILQ